MTRHNYSAPTPPVAVVMNAHTSWTLLEEDGTWQQSLRNRVFPFIIWLRTPSQELYELALSRMKCFPPASRREEWLCLRPDQLRRFQELATKEATGTLEAEERLELEALDKARGQ